MKALTIKQPYASLIANNIKDVENRTWRTNYRGKIYIHASSKLAKFDFEIKGQATSQEITISTIINKVEEEELFSCIIGEVEIVDCIKDSKSIWAMKNHWHWVLKNPVLYKEPILNVKGKLSFWEFNQEEQ